MYACVDVVRCACVHINQFARFQLSTRTNHTHAHMRSLDNKHNTRGACEKHEVERERERTRAMQCIIIIIMSMRISRISPADSRLQICGVRELCACGGVVFVKWSTSRLGLSCSLHRTASIRVAHDGNGKRQRHALFLHNDDNDTHACWLACCTIAHLPPHTIQRRLK